MIALNRTSEDALRASEGEPVYWNRTLETRPWAEVERWQAEQVAAFVKALPARSALYARLLEGMHAEPDIIDFHDLARLPFTSKDDVRAAQAATDEATPLGANQAAPLEEIVQVLSSSGTTGAPMYYALTRRDAEMWADAVASAWFTAGIRRHDVVAHLVALPMVAGGLPYADGFRRIGATLCWLGGFSTERILREIARLRVTALLATTSFGVYLSEQWQAAGASSSLRKVLCGGEPGLGQAEIRGKIAQGLATDHIREVMGLGDVLPALWAECEAGDGMHFTAQRYVAVELVDAESGEPVSWEKGATGELVYTTFVRDASPMLRYRSRDHALVVGTSCRCGRTSPRIRCIGRTDDMLIYKGMNLFPSAIRDLIATRFAGRVEPLIRIWKERADQVRFDDGVPLDVEAAPVTAADDYDQLAAEIAAEVREQMQVRVRVTVVPPATLERGTYKTSLVAVRG